MEDRYYELRTDSEKSKVVNVLNSMNYAAGRRGQGYVPHATEDIVLVIMGKEDVGFAEALSYDEDFSSDPQYVSSSRAAISTSQINSAEGLSTPQRKIRPENIKPQTLERMMVERRDRFKKEGMQVHLTTWYFDDAGQPKDLRTI